MTEPLSPFQSRLALRPRYAETDAMGIVHHAVYAVWFEMGRVDYLAQLGLPYREVEARGIFLVVTGLSLKLRKPAFFDDDLWLVSQVSLVRSRVFSFDYRLSRKNSDGSSDLLATGSTEHMAADRQRRAVMLPSYLLALLAVPAAGALDDLA
jgi:acyl-CoA thioester hydrolase